MSPRAFIDTSTPGAADYSSNGESSSKSTVAQRPLHRGAACLACRKKRAKCDGVHPMCGRCTRSNKNGIALDCVYETPPKSALTLLKERVDELEQNNINLIQQLRDPNGAPTTTDPIGQDQQQYAPIHPNPPPPPLQDFTTISAVEQFLSIAPDPHHQPPLNIANPNHNHNPPKPIPSLSHNNSYHPYLPRSASSRNATIAAATAVAAASIPASTSSPSTSTPSSSSRLKASATPFKPRSNSLSNSYTLGQIGGAPPPSPPDQANHQAPVPAPGDPFNGDAQPFPWSHTVSPYEPHGIVRARIPMPHNWWQNDEPSPEFHELLIGIFLSHRRQCACEFPVERFIQSLSGPPKDKPHPAFLNAIYMLACWFSHPIDLRALEPIFQKRAQDSLQDALSLGGKLLNFLQGAALLSLHHYGSGRMLEGYHQICSAAQIAMVCGFHQISSPIWSAPVVPEELYSNTMTITTEETRANFRRVPYLITPPRDAVELGERIHAFWSIWILDASGCATHGLPSMFDDEREETRVTTPLPVPLEQYYDGTIATVPAVTLQHFWAYEGITTYPDSPVTLRIKCTSVMQAACRLSTIWGIDPLLSAPPHRTDPTLDPSFQTKFTLISRTCTNLMEGMPNLPDSTSMGGEIVKEWFDAGIDPVMVHAWTMSLCAVLQLNNITASRNMEAYDACLGAARRTIGIIRQIQELDFFQLDIMLGICWMSTSHVLLRELERQKKKRNYDEVGVLQEELHVLHFVLHRLGTVYPLVEIQANKAESAFRERN